MLTLDMIYDGGRGVLNFLHGFPNTKLVRNMKAFTQSEHASSFKMSNSYLFSNNLNFLQIIDRVYNTIV